MKKTRSIQSGVKVVFVSLVVIGLIPGSARADRDDQHLLLSMDNACIGSSGLVYTGSLFSKCCNGADRENPSTKTELDGQPPAECPGSVKGLDPNGGPGPESILPVIQAASTALDDLGSNGSIANSKGEPKKEDKHEGSGGPIASVSAAGGGGVTEGVGMSGKDKSRGEGDAPVGARRGIGSGGGGSAGGGAGGGMNAGTIGTGVLGAEQAAATVGQEDPNAKYAGGGGAGSGGGGGRGRGGFGFGSGGFGGSGGGAAGPAELGFGAREDGTNPLGSADPEDYFTRTDLFANLFKVIEKRYRNKATDWARQDAKGVTPGAPLH